MHQATRVRFRGGDPLALTKRIQARREAKYGSLPDYRNGDRDNNPAAMAAAAVIRSGAVFASPTPTFPANAELDRVFGGEDGISPIRFREPIEPIVTSWKEAWSILWQAGLLIVLFVGIAWTGPIFAAVVLR